MLIVFTTKFRTFENRPLSNEANELYNGSEIPVSEHWTKLVPGSQAFGARSIINSS